MRREPAIGAQVRDAGHEIGVHSMEHLDHAEVGREASVADVVEGAAAIEQALGVTPRLFRAPYGHFVPGTLAEAERRGWTCVHWSAWGEDWREAETRESIAARAIADLRPGAIVLLHDGRREQAIECERMLGAVEDVLAEARRRGLEPVTVGELLARLESAAMAKTWQEVFNTGNGAAPSGCRGARTAERLLPPPAREPRRRAGRR